MTVSTAIEIRQRNKERIRIAIQRHEKCTKADIARETELSMATCSTALNEMMEAGEVLKVDQTGYSIGRPADLFTYNMDYMHVLAIGTAVRDGKSILEYAIADALGRVISREEMPVDTLNYELLEALVTTCLIQDPLIKAVGLGIPGHARDGYIEDCDIPTLSQLNFVERIQQKHDIEVIVENDMNFVTYRLYHECESKDASFATLYIPDEENSYVGCGFIVNGRLMKGMSMYAGELWRAAEAFGVTREQQQAFRSDREGLRKFVAQVIVAVACTINPANLTLMGSGMDQDDVDSIHRHCLDFVSQRNLPSLQVDNNIFDNYIEGLIRFALDSILYPIIV